MRFWTKMCCEFLQVIGDSLRGRCPKKGWSYLILLFWQRCIQFLTQGHYNIKIFPVSFFQKFNVFSYNRCDPSVMVPSIYCIGTIGCKDKRNYDGLRWHPSKLSPCLFTIPSKVQFLQESIKISSLIDLHSHTHNKIIPFIRKSIVCIQMW